jgi:phosphomannomutase
MDPAIFTASDITGVYPDQLNEEDAWKIGCAAARFLPSLVHGYARGQAHSQSLCVGRDMRKHSEALARALMEGINAAGANVIDIGMIDTPQMYFAINHLGTCGGVQVTASHEPGKYNGFQISGLGAKPVSADTGLKDIKYLATALIHTKGKVTGSVKKMDLTAEYKKYVLKFLNPLLKQLKIAVDASNGMAGKMLPAIFGDTPVKIVATNFEHTGRFKHRPDPLIEKNLAQVKSAVKKSQCDFGVCFDGDVDGMAFVDEKGQTVRSDLLTAMMVPYFLKKEPKSTVVYDLRSSRVVMEEIIKHGGTPRRERVGHTFMKKTMRDSHAIFGGELSGHFYYRDNYCNDSGLITLVHLLNIAHEAKVPISELVQPLRRYHSSDEMSFKVQDKQARMEELAKRYGDGQIDHLDGLTVGYKEWWFNCRPSDTEPLLRLNAEAKTKDLLEQKLAEIREALGKSV